MYGRFLCKPTLTVLLAAACGCGSDRVVYLAPDPDLAHAIAVAGEVREAVDVTRAQKPEGPAQLQQPIKMIDTPPERPDAVAHAPSVARIIATVNSEAILEEEVRSTTFQQLVAIKELPEPDRRQKTNDIINAALTQIVEREIVLQDMKARLKEKGEKILQKLKEAAEKEFDRQVLRAMRESGHFKTEEDFQDYFRAQGMSLDMVRRQWERSFMAMEYLRNVIVDKSNSHGSNIELREYYDKHPEEYKVDDNVVWQDLFIDASRHPTREAARAHAQALADRARKGEDFVALASKYDNGYSSQRKDAEGIGRRFNEIRPPEAAPVLFRLRDGEIGSLIELPTGFHIVRIVKREVAGLLPFDEKVQKQIREKIRNEVGQREMKRFVAELKRKAIIEYAAGH